MWYENCDYHPYARSGKLLWNVRQYQQDKTVLDATKQPSSFYKLVINFWGLNE